MNFASMDYFVMTAQERSFTRAADRLHITQQTLSAHIAALEKGLGNRLFVRSVPLELTYAGQVFLRYAIDFRRKRQSLEQEMGDIAGELRGILRIGIASTRGRTVMPLLIHSFRRIHPLVSVKIAEMANGRLQQALLDGEIDLAVANFPQAIPGIEIMDFYEEEVVLLVAKELLKHLYGTAAERFPEQIQSGGLDFLEGCPFLFNSPRDIAGKIGRDFLAQADLAFRIAAESSNMETLLDLCVLGEGACFCPENLMKAALSQKEMDALSLFRLGEAGRYMICFAYLRQEHPWSILRDFINMALKSSA